MKALVTTRSFNRGKQGYTLIEIITVIILIGIIAAVAIPKFGNFTNSARINATREEMAAIKKAIIGNPSAIAGGEYIDRGFEGDVGHVPSTLSDLVAKPDSISAYDPITRLGWNGPYLDSAESNYLRDAWDNNYFYNPLTRTIISTGGGTDTILIRF